MTKLILSIMAMFFYWVVVDAGLSYEIDGYGLHPMACTVLIIIFTGLVSALWNLTDDFE